MKKISILILALLCLLAFPLGCLGEEIAVPKADVPCGGVEKGTEVTLTAAAGCEIYYTLNGEDPTVKATPYREKIKISGYTCIKAVAVKNGSCSDIAVFSYQTDNLYTYRDLYDFESEKKGLVWNKDQWSFAKPETPAPVNGKTVMKGTFASEEDFDWSLDGIRNCSVQNHNAPYALIEKEKNPGISFWVWQDDAYDQEDCLMLTIDYRTDYDFFPVPLKAEKSGWHHYFIDLSKYDGYRVSWLIFALGEGDHSAWLDDVSLVSMAMAPVTLSLTHEPDFFEGDLLSMKNPSVESKILYQITEEYQFGEVNTYKEPFAPLQETGYLAWAADTATGYTSALSLYYVDTPQCSPPLFDYTENQDGSFDMTMTAVTPDSSVFYRIDNGEYQQYAKTIHLSGACKISLYAEKEGLRDSPVRTLKLTPAPIEGVTASVAADVPVAQGTKVTLSTPTLGAVIYYTLDGTVPSVTNGYVYDEPIVIDEDMNIAAIAVNREGKSSEAAFFSYTLKRSGDLFEPNNEFAYAVALGFPCQIDASIAPAGSDCDFYSFQIDSSCDLELRLLSEGKKPFCLTLLDNTGKELLRSLNQTNIGLHYSASPGRYYVRVDGVTGDYTLRLGSVAKNSNLDLAEKDLIFEAVSPNADHSFSIGVDSGGHYLMTTAVMARWSGVTNEENAPYDPIAYDEQGNVDFDKWLSPHHAPQAYHIQDILLLPNYDGDPAALKSAVYAYGALYISYMHNNNFASDNLCYYYSPYYYSLDGGGHAVTLVGWDDNIPKEKFETKDGDMPKEDGGFILKNSWGTKIGDEGYFYISYEDQSIGRINHPLAYVMAESTANYNVKYEYDTFGFVDSWGSDSDTVYGKNTFTAEEDFLLQAVGFTDISSDADYEVYFQSGDGEMERIASCHELYGGYHTLRLDKEISIQKGQVFSLILQSSAGSIPIETPEAGYTDATAEPGQSFCSYDGVNWKDISEDDENVCLKAFGHSDQKAAVKTVSSVKEAADPSSETGIKSPQSAEDITPEMYQGDLAAVDLPTTTAAAAPFDVLPANFDLRDCQAVTSVKNQGPLGSCWAFASIAALESSILRTSSEAYSYPVSIAVDRSKDLLTLTDGVPVVDFKAAAIITPENCGTDLIYWSFGGDLDSIDILTNQSVSGEKTVLFRAKAPGTVTVTATAAADSQKKAVAEIKIVSEKLSEWENPYGDVHSDDWFYDEVWYASLHKLMVGTSSNTFEPDSDMSRAMAITVLGRLVGVDPDAYTENSFDDVPAGTWYHGYVEWGLKEGIVAGVGDKKFAPNDAVTREQMISFFYRYAKPESVNDETLASFTDKENISGYAKDAMAWAVEIGLLCGYDDGTLRPAKILTRGEMAAFLTRLDQMRIK